MGACSFTRRDGASEGSGEAGACLVLGPNPADLVALHLELIEKDNQIPNKIS